MGERLRRVSVHGWMDGQISLLGTPEWLHGEEGITMGSRRSGRRKADGHMLGQIWMWVSVKFKIHLRAYLRICYQSLTTIPAYQQRVTKLISISMFHNLTSYTHVSGYPTMDEM